MLDQKIMKYIPKKYAGAIKETEICSLDGYWVYLKDGFICEATESISCHGETIKELLADVRTIRKVENKNE